MPMHKQTNSMKAYRRPRQYIYHPCQPGRVAPGLGLLVSVCTLMLPMLVLVDEHVQLTTMYHINPVNQWSVHPHHVTFNHTPLLPSLNNVLPAMALQNRVVRLNIDCASYTSSHSSVHHVPPILHLNLPSGLGRRVVGVVVVLLLLMSGDIETNPGPVGQHLSDKDLLNIMEELADVRAKWYNIGLGLGLGVGTLNCIKIEHSDTSDCLRETLMIWMKSYPPPPTWSKVVDALRTKTVGEVRLAADLEQKYCTTQDIAASHQHTPPVQAVLPSQAHTQTTSLPQFTVPLTQPPVIITSPQSVPPQPYPSHSPPWSVPYHSPHPLSTPPTSYPMSTPSGEARTDTSLSAYSQLPQVTPDPTPSVRPIPVPVQPVALPSDAVQSMTIQPDVAADENKSSPLQAHTWVTPPPLPTPSRLVPPTPVPVQSQHLSFLVPTTTSSSQHTVLPSSPISDHPAPPTEMPITPSVNTSFHHSAQEHTVLLDKYSVKQCIKQFEDRFLELIDCTYDLLVDNGINVHRLHARLVSLDVSRQVEHQEFINNYPMNIGQATTFNNLWARLGSYWNFLNYDLLEHIVSRFGSKDLKQKMVSYECDLQSFRKTTRLCDFIDCWPVRGQTPPETELREFVARVGHDWEKCTLEHLDMLEGVITRKFFLPKFALRLREITPGSITIMWLIPAPFVNSLLEAIETTSSEFFAEHKIETIIVDGQDCYPFPRFPKEFENPKEKFISQSLRENTSEEKMFLDVSTSLISSEVIQFSTHSKSQQHFSSQSMRESQRNKKSPMVIIPKMLYPLKPGKSKKTKLLNETHRVTEEIYISSDESASIVPFDTQHETSLQLDKLNPQTITPRQMLYSSTHEMGSCSGEFPKPPIQGDEFHPTTPADKHVREKCEISQQVQLLPSVQYEWYLSSNPAIRSATYTPVIANMSAEVFTWSQHTKSPPPTTMTELFTAFSLKTLVDHLSTHPVYHKQQLKITAFSDLPTDVYKQFQGLCRMAYQGVLNQQQLVFPVAELPTGFAPLGLMQEVSPLHTEGRTSSYHFAHMTLQEYLAAVHISQLPAHEQTILVQENLDRSHFKMTIQFLSGLTKLANIPPDNIRRLMESSSTKHTYFHLLFETKNISVTTRTLGSDEINVKPDYSWTPLDCYVTGHAISHSNCPWRLNFQHCSIDNEKFELFCQGCAVPEETGCRGHILRAHFGGNEFTSKSIHSFVNVPPHILQGMRVLELDCNKLDGNACDLLAKAVPSLSRLEELWLDSNPIGSSGAVEVIKVLCGSGVHKLLKVLRLYNTRIGEPDCEALCVLLKSSHSLQHLNIGYNNLSSESVASIITGLSHNSSLTKLNISNSHFSMADVVRLATVLKDQLKCTLTILVLRDCHISGVSELAAALCKNLTLKYLYLDQNPIGVEGASSISDMLQYNTSLEKLYLCDDSVGEKGVHQLINSLKHNQTLRKLWLPKEYKPDTSDDRIDWW